MAATNVRLADPASSQILHFLSFSCLYAKSISRLAIAKNWQISLTATVRTKYSGTSSMTDGLWPSTGVNAVKWYADTRLLQLTVTLYDRLPMQGHVVVN